MKETTRLDIVRDGKFTIPLFHGTSTVFLDSIREHGLGGINPIDKMGVMQSLDLLLKQADERYAHCADWVFERREISKIEGQEVRHYNFRHGSVYLTTSRLTAERYAVINPFGSELVSRTIMLLEKLEQSDYQPRQDELHDLGQLLYIRKLQARPIVLEVVDVAVEHVRSEMGEDPWKSIIAVEQGIKEALREWQKKKDTIDRARRGDKKAVMILLVEGQNYKEAKELDAWQVVSEYVNDSCQQWNFELKCTLPYGKVIVHYLA